MIDKCPKCGAKIRWATYIKWFECKSNCYIEACGKTVLDQSDRCKMNQARELLERCEERWSDEISNHSEICDCERCETRKMLAAFLRETALVPQARRRDG